MRNAHTRILGLLSNLPTAMHVHLLCTLYYDPNTTGCIYHSSKACTTHLNSYIVC